MKKKKELKIKKSNFILRTIEWLKTYPLRQNPILKIYKKSYFKNRDPVEQNIYDRKTHGESLEADHIIHYKFKYHFFLPALSIGKWILRKQIDQARRIPDLPHNNNFTIFNQAFDESVIQWKRSYQMVGITLDKKTHELIAPSKEQIAKMVDKNHGSEGYLYTMKDIMLTMCYNDTAYREFFNMLIYNIGLKTIEKYRGQHVSHLLYNSTDIYDVRYFAIQNALAKQQQGEVNTAIDNIPRVTIKPGNNKGMTVDKKDNIEKVEK
jgi:hypothetical protein